MASTSRIAVHPHLELPAPVEAGRERRERNWLGAAWSAIFVIYCAAVLPLLGWAIVQAF
jgi:hypothetical protein